MKEAADLQMTPSIIQSASTVEADIYRANRKLLQRAGVNVDVGEDKELGVVLDGLLEKELTKEYDGVGVPHGARIVLSPSFGLTQSEIRSKFKQGGTIQISDKSTLILDGEGISIEGLVLDGTLVVRTVPGAEVIIQGLVI